jgi:peptide chain release factor subunit 3
MQIIAKVETTAPICLETYKAYPQLGRFTLRDEGKTIAMGKVSPFILEAELYTKESVARF